VCVGEGDIRGRHRSERECVCGRERHRSERKCVCAREREIDIGVRGSVCVCVREREKVRVSKVEGQQEECVAQMKKKTKLAMTTQTWERENKGGMEDGRNKCVCVCVRERERDVNKNMWIRYCDGKESKRESLQLDVRICEGRRKVCVRERECVSVFVKVGKERERRYVASRRSRFNTWMAR